MSLNISINPQDLSKESYTLIIVAKKALMTLI